MDTSTVLETIRAHFPELARRYGVRGMRLFGSVARGDARHDSDVDILVEFEGPATYSAILGVSEYLERLLGRAVDLVTPNGLRPRVLRAIEEEAVRVA